MLQVKKTYRKVWTIFFALMMLCISMVCNVHAAEETEDVYTLTWKIDEKVYEEQQYKAGDTIVLPENEPKKTNYVFLEWAEVPETMPEENLTIESKFAFDGTLVTDLENVYECYLYVSDEIAVTMYLRMDAEGNFVFSRSTDFSDVEKGAGKVYKKSEIAEIKGGKYAVDISWSPMAGMMDPILEIDAENMTFAAYSEADPAESKGNGNISYTDGEFALNFADGNVTTFIYEEDVITFTSKLWYGSASFNRADEDENFVPYEAVLTEEAVETEEKAAEDIAEDALEDALLVNPGEYCLVYYVVDGETVTEGAYVSTFEVTEKGSILFTSPFWFGATEPKFLAEDEETVTYPEFIVSAEKITADINKEVISASASKKEETEEKKPEGSGTLKTGTYGGNYTTTAMGSSLTYAVSMNFFENGTYSYTVKFNMMGSAYTESESGTYTVNGSTITLVSSEGTTMNGTVNGNSISITRYVSTYAFSPATITLTYGTTVSAPPSAANPSGSENEKEDTDKPGTEEPDKKPENDSENKPGEKPDDTVIVDKEKLSTGKYNVDISWSPMAAMFAPVVEINAEKMTFDVYNANDPSASKGAGKITEADGVYTLVYDNGNTTTFTYDSGVITFTSKLWYGAASFNNENEAGKFVSYTAEIKNASVEKPGEDDKDDTVTPTPTPDTEKPSVTPAPDKPDVTPAPEKPSVTPVPDKPDVTPTPGTGDEEEKEDTKALASGAYNVDISWSPMAAMFSPVVEIDAENLTFKVYNASTPETVKGSGNITYADGVYTLAYENGETTTFTYENSVMTFTSKLWYGMASFNNMDEDGNFITYTASASAGGSDKEPVITTGVYGGVYEKVSPMAGTVNYKYTLTLKEDKTYTYYVEFPMGGTTYDSSEEGTYTFDAETITFTSVEGTVTTGAVKDTKVTTVTRRVSSFAAADTTLEMIYGYVHEEEKPAFVTGNYGGTYTSVSSSGSTTEYAYTLSLNADASYTYKVEFGMGGSVYVQTENGTYTAKDGILTLVSAGLEVKDADGGIVMSSSAAETMTGTIAASGHAATITRYVSYFAKMAGSPVELSLTYGASPSVSMAAVMATAAEEVETEKVVEEEAVETEAEEETVETGDAEEESAEGENAEAEEEAAEGEDTEAEEEAAEGEDTEAEEEAVEGEDAGVEEEAAESENTEAEEEAAEVENTDAEEESAESGEMEAEEENAETENADAEEESAEREEVVEEDTEEIPAA